MSAFIAVKLLLTGDHPVTKSHCHVCRNSVRPYLSVHCCIYILLYVLVSISRKYILLLFEIRERILSSKIVYHGYGVVGVVITYSLFTSSKNQISFIASLYLYLFIKLQINGFFCIAKTLYYYKYYHYSLKLISLFYLLYMYPGQ